MPAAHSRSRAWLAFGALALSVLSRSAAADAQYVELSAGYKSGDFGSDTQSRLYVLAPSWGYLARTYDYGVTVPVLRLSERTAGASTTEAGLGDIVVRAGRTLWARHAGPELYGSLVLKLPTADEDAGLGTGAADVGAFLNLRDPLPALPLGLYGGYIVVGDGSGQNLHNVGVAGASLSGLTSAGYLYGGLEWRSASVPGAPSALEMQFGWLHSLGARHLFKLTAFTGFTDGGPDYGLSIGVVRWLGAGV